MTCHAALVAPTMSPCPGSGFRAVPPRSTRLSTLRATLLALLLPLVLLKAWSTPITYQGRLVDDGQLADGTYEITFRLFDSATGGTQTGPALVKPSVTVQLGLFTEELDFGDTVFTGAPRWLELSTRESGSADPAETLAPRQAVHAVPYALRAFSGSGNASELTSGTVPDARLSPSIVRTAELLFTSNALSAQWTAMSARLDQLEASLIGISNAAKATIPAGVNVVSTDPADPGLFAQGMVPFFTVPAVGWRNGQAGGPSERSSHSAVWTGQGMIVWGGLARGGNLSNLGSRYDPELDQWFPISEINPPTARRDHSAVWTGQGMIVWGGFGGGFLGTGSFYSPANLSWTSLPALQAPAGRDGHAAVWTGARMLIWGGRDFTGLLTDGGLYDPAAQQWTTLPTSDAPDARVNATAVWTGSQFIVWGGLGTSGELSTGARLPFTSGAIPGAWSLLESSGAPSARVGHTAVWTGQRFIVWGGHSGATLRSSGAAYDPIMNSWQPLPSLNAPSPRTGHVAVWTGAEMLIFGGQDASGDLASGAAYNPTAGTWRTLSNAGSPVARRDASGTWTGSELLVFGGLQGSSPLAALQRLNPQPSWHFYRKP